MNKSEEKLHIAICDYMKLAYPNVMFISEASGVRTTIGTAAKLKRMRSSHTHLDLYILEKIGKFGALIIELKAKNIFKKDGSLLKDQHLEDQAKTIMRLRQKGYAAGFACGFDEAKKIIDQYLNGDYEGEVNQ